MNELSPVRFSIGTAATPEQRRENVAHALSLRLPEADDGGRLLHVVADGPTARGFDFATEDDTLAVNGAIKLFADAGRAPTFWCACDPTLDVLDCLDAQLPASTTYLLASKCHPKIFERLRGYDVRVWHVSDCDVPGFKTVPCAVSVTLCAAMLATRLGYRRLPVWGWDCCYAEDGQHHASGTPMSDVPDQIEIEVDGVDRRYQTNPTWACEVEDARKILTYLKWFGVEVSIHGRSLVSAVLPDHAA